MAIVIFVLVLIVCFPFIKDMLMGVGVSDENRILIDGIKAETCSHDVMYITYFVFVILCGLLIHPFTNWKRQNKYYRKISSKRD